MSPHRLSAALLLLCLLLVFVAYRLGVETGRAAALKLHPGYEAAARRVVPE